MSERIAGVILAGGRSRRMGGGDKGLLALGGRPILEHVVARLSPQVAPLVLNANGDPARFSDLGLPVIADSVENFAGPLAGILAGLEWASAHTACMAIVTAAGDTPFFPESLVARLALAGRPEAIAVASCGGRRHPTFARWPLALREALRAFLVDEEGRRVTTFIDRHEHVDVDFPVRDAGGVGFDPFFNVNTPEDLAEAARILEGIEP